MSHPTNYTARRAEELNLLDSIIDRQNDRAQESKPAPDYKACQTLHSLQADKAAVEWWQIMARDSYAAVYLYYRTGELACFANDPPAGQGWTLGSGERFHGGFSRAEVRARVFEIARRLPFLPV